MTVSEFRAHKEYEVCMNKINAYKKGFKFTLNYAQIPKPKANALKIVIRDAIEEGLIEIVQTGLSLELEVVDETYRRI